MLEWVCAACFFGLAELLLPLIGAAGAGWAYTGMYATYLLFFSIAARRLCPLLNLRPACLLLIQGCGGLALVMAAQLLFDHGAAVATGFSFFFCVRAWHRIRAELRV